ncbi:MAG: hypothetical protein AAGC55_30685, partial [Myxococcota bacterium]
ALTLAGDPEKGALIAGPGQLAIGRGGAEVAVALRGLVRYGELDGVIIAASTWRAGQPAVLGQYCATVAIACTRIIEIRYRQPGDEEAAAETLWRALSAEPRPGPPALLGDPRLTRADRRPVVASSTADANRSDRPSDARPACRWCRSPWLWLGVGSAAAVVGVTTWLVLRDRDLTAGVTADPCQFGSCR